MSVTNPSMLWLLLPFAAFPLVYARHRSGLSSPRLAAVAALTMLSLAALVLALARPVLSRTAVGTVSVVVADLSPSITDGDLAEVERRVEEAWRFPPGADERRHVVVFSGTARVVETPEPRRPGWLAGLRASVRESGSALADGIELGASMVPEARVGQVKVFTDAMATRGDAAAAVMRARWRGIDVVFHRCGAARMDEILVQSCELPAEARVGQRASLRVVVDAGRPGPAVLTVTNREVPAEVMRRPVELRQGVQELAFPLDLAREGRQSYRVRCEGGFDTDPTNNEQDASVFVEAPYSALVLQDEQDGATAGALSAILGASARVTAVSPEGLDAATDALEQTGLLVIADVAAERLSPALQDRIRAEVREGLGLFFVGGRRSFGPGGYRQAAISEVMPLEFSQQVQKRDPSVTLVVIIDTSGSMTGPRLALAKEVARLAVRRLQPHDKVGIVEFYGTRKWAARIQSAANAIDINRALNRLSAGGGTVILPAIEEAYYALLNVQTRTKHVLIITDGGVETGAFEAIITRMAEAGITVSTVMAGPGQHSTFLSSLAHWGNGRFYPAPDRFSLPEALFKQPESVPATPFVEEAATLEQACDDPVFADLELASAPPIDGYVRTTARPTADLLIRSGQGDPVLTRWRFGRGFVATWSSDLGGPWTTRLAQWPSFATLLSNLSREMAAPQVGDGLRVVPLHRPAGTEIRIDCIGRRLADPFAAIELTLSGDAEPQRSWELDPLRAGEWNDLLTGLTSGSYELLARTADDSQRGRAAFTITQTPEVSATASPDVRLDALARIAEKTSPAARMAEPTTGLELYPILVLASLVLLLASVLVRRLPYARPGTAVVLILAFGSCLTGEKTLASASSSAPASAPASQPLIEHEIGRLLSEAARATSLEQVRPALDAAMQRISEAGDDPAELRSRLAAAEDVHPISARLIALCAAERGDFNRARRVLERAIVAGATDVSTWTDLARWLELSGEAEGAASALEVAGAKARNTAERLAVETRRAQLLFDLGRHDEGRTTLTQLGQAMEDPQARVYIRNLLAVLDEPQAAAEQSGTDAPAAAPQELLLKAALCQRAGKADEAARCFERAAATLPIQRDRVYAIQQQIAIARQSRRLGALADQWLARRDLPADHLLPLLTVLRELRRVDDALSLLERGPISPEHDKVVEGVRFQEELVAAALDAGRLDAAEQVYRSLIVREPEHLDWRIALARLRLLLGRRNEAESVLEEMAVRAGSTEELVRVADAARNLALDSVALRAIDRVARQGPSGAFRAGIWRAELLERRGRLADAVAELEQLVPVTADDAATTRELADAFEKYARPQRAIALLRQIVTATGDEDANLRLAYLLEQTQQFEEARKLWRRIWEAAATPAQESRAAKRLLDLAAKTGVIADLAIEIEERLGNKRATEKELSLLVDIYTQIGDAVSTGEVLFAFARQSGREVDALRQLSRAYLRMGRLAQTEQMLRRLLELDPARSADYLQEMMVLAVERQRPREAQEIVERIAAIGGDDSIGDELGAGIFELIGEHDRSARLYARVIARFPDRVEVWLLWANAMRAAGRAEEALGRLQVLAEEAEQDDLFLVAIDGMLNLEAGRAPLQSALRRLRERIAASPDKIFLYDIATDVMDSSGQAERINPLMETAIAFAGEQRGELLREMMDRAKAAGDRERVIRYGNALVASDYNVPPQVLLDLGETLLGGGLMPEAERAFARACLLGDYATIRQKVADSYERAGLPAPAERILSELLITDPTNVALLHRSAILLEQLGRFEDAFRRHSTAVETLFGKLPATAEAKTPAAEPGPTTRRRPTMAANVDEMTQFLEPTLDGLLTTARTDTLRAQLLQILRTFADRERDASTAGDLAKINTVARFPRLSRIADALRVAAFALHHPEAADAFDQTLRRRFPSDLALAYQMVRQRLAWGLYERAETFAAGLTALPPEIKARRFVSASQPASGPVDGKAMDASVAGRALPMLIMLGRDEQARQVLDACLAEWKSSGAESARTMLVSAIALDDPVRLEQWLLRYLDGCKTVPAGERLVTAVVDGLRPAWNLLSPTQQRTVLQRLDELAGASRPRSVEIDLLRLSLDPASVTGEARRSILEAACKGAARPAQVVSVLQRADEPWRAPLLEQAWTARPPADRFELLLAVAAGVTQSCPDDFSTAFRRLLEACPPVRLNRHTPYQELARARWNRNFAQPVLGRIVADYLLAQLPREVPVQAASAVAFASAGDAQRSLELGRRALAALLADRKLEADQEDMIVDLARCLPRADREKAVQAARQLQQSGQAAVIDLYVASVMLQQLGWEDEAVAVLRDAMAVAPTSVVVRRTLLAQLETSRRWCDAIDIFKPYLSDRSVVQDGELHALSEAYRQQFDPLGAINVLSMASGPIGFIRTLQLDAMLGRRDRVQLVLRRYLATNRLERRFYTPLGVQPPQPGGLQEYMKRQQPDFTPRLNLFTLLAPLPGVDDEFEAMWQAAPPDRRDIYGLAQARVAAAAAEGRVDKFAAMLSARLRESSFNGCDQQLLTELAGKPGVSIPADAMQTLDGRMTGVPPDQLDTLETWARLHENAGDRTRAAHIERWVLAMELCQARRSAESHVRHRRLDLYLANIAPDRRAAETARLLNASILTPLEPPGDRLDATLLDRLTQAGLQDLAMRQETRLRDWLSHDNPAAYYPGLHQALAKACLARGDLAGFEEHVDEMIRLCPLAYGDSFPADALRALPPPTGADDRCRQAVDLVSAAVDRAVADDRLSRPHAVRALALLGNWCLQAGMSERAARIVTSARSSAGDVPGESWLWVADLAAGIDPAQALAMEKALLNARRLPIARAVDLLDRIERAEGQVAADRLALAASAYTDLPEVLERALREASRQKDQAAAARLAARLGTYGRTQSRPSSSPASTARRE